MLNNLKGELTKLGLSPAKSIIQSLGCSESTARKKLGGISPFTVPEADKIMSDYFQGSVMDIRFLFHDGVTSSMVQTSTTKAAREPNEQRQ